MGYILYKRCYYGKAKINSIGTQSIINPLLNDEKWRDTLRNEFNTVTVDSGLYYAEVEPEKGVFDFRRADLQIRKLSELGFPIRGHALIFPTSGSLFPDWLRNGNYSKDELRETLLSGKRLFYPYMGEQGVFAPTFSGVTRASQETRL